MAKIKVGPAEGDVAEAMKQGGGWRSQAKRGMVALAKHLGVEQELTSIVDGTPDAIENAIGTPPPPEGVGFNLKLRAGMIMLARGIDSGMKSKRLTKSAVKLDEPY